MLPGRIRMGKTRAGMWSLPVILEPIALYCERVAPGLLGEPFNLVATMALLPVAVWIHRAAKDAPALRMLAHAAMAFFVSLAALHSWSNLLALASAILAVLAIVLGLFYLVNRHLIGLSPRVSLVATLMILPLNGISMLLVLLMSGPLSSLAFLPIPILLLGYTAVLRHEKPAAARQFFAAALIIGFGLLARSIDHTLCDRFPHGMHFLWILSFATVVWLLARVLRSHLLAGQAGEG